LRETGSTSAAPPSISRATNPRQHRPKDISKPRRDIHLVEIKYCKDTRPLNQLNAQRDSKKIFATFSKEPPLFSTSSFWVWAAQPTTLTLWSLSRNWISILRVKKLASKLHVHFVNFAAELVHTRRAVSSTVINSHQEPVSGQACSPPDPH